MYLVSSKLTATGVRSRTFNSIAVPEYARYTLLKVFEFSQWVTRYRDNSDNRIWRPEDEMRKFTCLCIGPLSRIVNDLWCHCNNVASVDDEHRADHCLLAFQPIEEMFFLIFALVHILHGYHNMYRRERRTLDSFYTSFPKVFCVVPNRLCFLYITSELFFTAIAQFVDMKSQNSNSACAFFCSHHTRSLDVPFHWVCLA